MFSGIAFEKSEIPDFATPMPARPPRIASRALSTSSCRMTRARVAPSDARMPISSDRDADCMSSRLATLAHAMRTISALTVVNASHAGFVIPPLL